MCCRLKMKLEELWQRASGCILNIKGVTPDGEGNFDLQAGQNINISEVSNGLRISTTGGVSYYTSDDPQVDIDNDDLKISLVDVAKDSDLDVVAQSVANIIDGTTQVGDAAHADAADSATSATNSVNAQYLGSSTNNVGSDTKPVKIVNGVATEITDALATELYASNPNQLINNVNDWLNVNLNNKDANVNRTTILTNNVTTNRPQQTGESVYCYFGTRMVFWQAAGFVTVLAIGQGNDSAAHIWINNYNTNAGTWGGWKRVI